jgi:hypothetical protein
MGERFADRFIPEPNSGCYLWTGTLHARGYGMILPNGSNTPMLAHRVAYELHCGPIEPGMVICHRCDNPPCVNPAHLFVGTQADNLADMDRKGRRQRNSAVDPEIIRAIRADSRPAKELAALHNISVKTVRNYRDGKTWSHIA